MWFQRWGIGAWLIVGILLVVVGLVWLLEQTSSIVDPLIAGFVISAVSGVAVDRLERRGWPRAAGAGLLALRLVALTVLTIGLVLLYGVARGISGLTSVLVFLGFTAFATFFLVKDAPAIGRWIERHMGMDPAEARIVLGDIIRALRRYFLGLTIIAGLTTAGVVLGSLIVGVPLLGTIAIVTFLSSYIPIVGAWTAGIFVFALALANQGTAAALVMAVIVFLANGPLQQIVQPIVYGATLRPNPLVVFSVTIAAGALLGLPGMILAAPIVSAAVRVHEDLARLRTSAVGDSSPHASADGSCC